MENETRREQFMEAEGSKELSSLETVQKSYCTCYIPYKQEYGVNCTKCNKPVRGLGDAPFVPAELIELFRQVVTLCRSAGCSSLQLSINPGWRQSFHSQVKVDWHCGRHDVPSSFNITTELRNNISV